MKNNDMEKYNFDKMTEMLKIDFQNEKTAIGFMLQNEKAAISAVRTLQAKYFITPQAAHIFKIVCSCIGSGKTVGDVMFQIRSIVDEDWKTISLELDICKTSYISDCLTQSITFVGTDIFAESAFQKIEDQYIRRTVLEKYDETKKKYFRYGEY